MRVILQVTHFISNVWIVVDFLAVLYVRAKRRYLGSFVSRALNMEFGYSNRSTHNFMRPVCSFSRMFVLFCFFFFLFSSFVVREKLTCHKFLLRNPNEQIVSSLECACIKANPKKNNTKITMCIIVLLYSLIWRHRRHSISSAVSYFPRN